MAYQTLKLEFSGEIATITLNRPEKRNAISAEMIADLQAALAEVEDEPRARPDPHRRGQSILLRHGPRRFEGPRHAVAAEHLEDARRTGAALPAIWSFPKPTIAAVNGPAIAGGCGIATLCDFTMAVPEAKFGYPEVRIGFLPAIVSVFLDAPNRRKARARPAPDRKDHRCRRSHRLGLVTQIVPAKELMIAAQILAANLLECSPASLLMTKKLLCDFAAPEVDRELELAAAESAQIRTTQDFREGLAPSSKSARPAGAANDPLPRPNALHRPSATISLPMSDFVDTVVRVRYAETDKMGIVYYANYYIYFEIGRVEFHAPARPGLPAHGTGG